MTDDLRTRFDNLARRADETARPDALDRLDRARHRRNRSRKVGALVIATLIAIGGTATALIAFDGDDDASRVAGDPSPTADPWTPPDVLTVWPENPMREDDVARVQAAVDNGDESLAWRLNAGSVAERFGAEVLGWSGVRSITVVGQPVMIDAPFEVEYWQIQRRCVEGMGEKATCEDPLGIRLIQPATQGDGGIWSVSAVTSRSLRLRGLEHDTGRLLAGGDLPVDLHVPEGRSAHIGIVATNGCEDVIALDPGLSAGKAALLIPPVAASAGCSRIAAGYAFAYVQDDTTVPVGDPLLEAAAIVSPYITIVPVRVELLRPAPSPASSLPG